MKEIYNTLTTSRSIKEFLTDGGEIVVTYNYIQGNADFYDTKNVKKITCIYKACEENGWSTVVTEMNKFFMCSLTKEAKATEIIKSKGEISIKFTLKETNDSFEAMENENRIINELTEEVEDKTKELEAVEHSYERYCQDKVLFETIEGKRLTNKFIDDLKTNKEIVEILNDRCIYINNGCFDNNTIRDMIKAEMKYNSYDINDANSSYSAGKYYEETINKLYAYVG